ncbi:catalase [Actinoplanes sp. CA-030573]|uniref:catalase n=1 Tax=Actinoplanes sp. CA-030573 TaxID=3239898 RepID=UPI003D93DE26
MTTQKVAAQTDIQSGAAELPARLVEDLHGAFGRHHARAVHAKGTILRGRFRPHAAASTLSEAAIFIGSDVPVVARVSDFTGLPDIPDAAAEANPRGLAVRFSPLAGAEVDVVSHSYDGFPVATAAEFSLLLRAIAAHGHGDDGLLTAFFETHPVAKTFLTTQKPAPRSYATLTYFGVNAFTFTNAAGVVRHVRYRFVPEAGEDLLDDEELAASGPDYLQREIKARVAANPVAFTWFAQLAEAGDDIEDPSSAWPQSRELVRLGRIELDAMADDPDTDRALMFRPATDVAGIRFADPMLATRAAAYPISFAERQ